MAETPILLVAACALLREIGGKPAVLLAERPKGKNLAGFWEFPGGKIERGERPEQALARELAEELGIKASEADFVPLSFASHGYSEFHLLMPLYACRRFAGEPRPREGQRLSWVSAEILAADYALCRERAAQAEEDGACAELAGEDGGLEGAGESGGPKTGLHFALPPADIALVPALLAAMRG